MKDYVVFSLCRSFPLVLFLCCSVGTLGWSPCEAYLLQRGFLHVGSGPVAEVTPLPSVMRACVGCLLRCGTPPSPTFTLPLLLFTRFVSLSNSFYLFLHSFSPAAPLPKSSRSQDRSDAEWPETSCNQHRHPLISHRDCSRCSPSLQNHLTVGIQYRYHYLLLGGGKKKAIKKKKFLARFPNKNEILQIQCDTRKSTV